MSSFCTFPLSKGVKIADCSNCTKRVNSLERKCQKHEHVQIYQICQERMAKQATGTISNLLECARGRIIQNVIRAIESWLPVRNLISSQIIFWKQLSPFHFKIFFPTSSALYRLATEQSVSYPLTKLQLIAHHISGWGTADADINDSSAENLERQMFSLSGPGVGEE